MRAWEERTLLHFHIQRASPQHHAAHPKPVPRTAEPTARGRSSSINPLSKSNQEDRGSVRVLIVWLRCACEMCVCVETAEVMAHLLPHHLLRRNRRITSLSYRSSSASSPDDPSSREHYEILSESKLYLWMVIVRECTHTFRLSWEIHRPWWWNRNSLFVAQSYDVKAQFIMWVSVVWPPLLLIQ